MNQSNSCLSSSIVPFYIFEGPTYTGTETNHTVISTMHILDCTTTVVYSLSHPEIIIKDHRPIVKLLETCNISTAQINDVLTVELASSIDYTTDTCNDYELNTLTLHNL
jgi:hypothetical protein